MYREKKVGKQHERIHNRVYDVNTDIVIDIFIGEFSSVDELRDFMDSELHNYNEPYLKLHYSFSEA